jgi:hypothetical protein
MNWNGYEMKWLWPHLSYPVICVEEPTQALVKTVSVLVKIQKEAFHNSRQECYSFNQLIQKFSVNLLQDGKFCFYL